MNSPNAPDHETIRHYYDEEYYARLDREQRVPWHMRVVASRLGDFKDVSVLDVACGTGGWLAELAGRGASVAGIDISARAVEVARARLPVAELHEGVAEKLPFDDASFDIVTCMGSLEHFLDQPLALREMRRVSRHDARLLVLVPNAGFMTRRLGLYKGTGQVAVRETVRQIEEWQGMIESAGFKVVDRWRDLHMLDKGWIARESPFSWPVRFAQAVALAVWPLDWQYQVYFLARAA